MLSKIFGLVGKLKKSNEHEAIEKPHDVLEESIDDATYSTKLEQEITRYKQVENVHDLPKIYHYWSRKYLKPMLLEFGISDIDHLFADNLYQSAVAAQVDKPHYISIGSGNCDLEVRVSKLLKEKGLHHFTMECLELNPHMIERGKELSEKEKVSDCMLFVQADFNLWKPDPDIIYTAAMANHSLHHVTNLEGLFSSIKSSLHWAGKFVVSDMIGRNGHQRWPEALEVVQQVWKQLPDNYRYNHLLKRHEPEYDNWDCSGEGFEGIRAQDIMPLLLDRFDFEIFIGFLNVMAPFIDRCFGHNFDATADWDQSFIDRIQAID
jgi:SAM-dependent methyltransferase